MSRKRACSPCTRLLPRARRSDQVPPRGRTQSRHRRAGVSGRLTRARHGAGTGTGSSCLGISIQKQSSTRMSIAGEVAFSAFRNTRLPGMRTTLPPESRHAWRLCVAAAQKRRTHQFRVYEQKPQLARGLKNNGRTSLPAAGNQQRRQTRKSEQCRGGRFRHLNGEKLARG